MTKKRATFATPWTLLPDGLREHVGQPFEIVKVYRHADAEHDAEVLPMYRVQFSDGYEVDAWPEEIGE